MPFIIPANSALASGGYNVANSCKFNAGSSDYLSRTFGSGNRKTWTWSAWIKLANINSSSEVIFGRLTANNDSSWFTVDIRGNDKITIGIYNTNYLITNRLFRDTSAWYHIVVAFDTTQGTANNRVRLYINGVEETSFATRNNPSQNFDAPLNANVQHLLGKSYSSYYEGYMSEVTFIDGQQLAPTDFGEFDEDSGVWKPIDVSGLTFGTNGFYLDFEDSSALGNDANGSNNWTANNLTAVDQSTDTCTNNFATANPLANLVGSPTYSKGNLEVTGNSSANHNWQSTIGVSSGKWYWEMKSLASSPDTGLLFYDQSIAPVNSPGAGFGTLQRQKIVNSAATGSAIGSTAQNDIHGMALDLDNGKMFIHRNGTYLLSGDPANGTNPFIVTADGLATEGVFGGYTYDGTVQLNFGNPAFAISSGNADGDGFGNFEYAPPSGFFALCTKNLAEYG